jgi:APA family basic amino acid/polyamine antiporter
MGKVHNFTPMSGSVSSTAGFGAAVLGTLWAYDGWISVGNVAGEIKDPAKDLPRSIIFGLVLCIVVYVLVNLALLNVLPMKSIIASGKPASDAAVILFGKGGAAIISAGIMISIFGALNGYLMTGARVPFAMSQDNLLPFSSFLGKVTNGSKTPVNSLIFETILASLYVLTGSFNLLTDLVVFVLWIFFTMAVAGIFILRTKYKDLKRPYKVPLYPVVPIIGIVGGLFIIINTLKTDTANALYGVIITLIGIPVYMYMMKKKNLSK